MVGLRGLSVPPDSLSAPARSPASPRASATTPRKISAFSSFNSSRTTLACWGRDTCRQCVDHGGDAIPPANTTWFDAIKAPCTPYDPADAKRLVARSGFPTPTVRLLTNTTADFQKLAPFIQAEEAAVGINVVIESADSATVIAREISGNLDVVLGGFQPGVLSPRR
jgi:ABC-type transport system substrate-binding protein